ncbi:MAG: alpha-L-fucosidase [Halobacteriaceae archaeon]
MAADYDETWESLDTHAVPDWYHDAKLGIFIHWGVYSVPAWAPVGDYAEWYPYHMYQEGSETHEYHREQYGEDVEYEDFAPEFTAENWDPSAWAEFFADVGAGYVVLTGEHHDGFPLWDTHYQSQHAGSVGPERDLVGDLCEAARAEGLRFAASYHANLNYYQPGFPGAFGHPDYGGETVDDASPGSEYVDFMNAKHRELIRKYEPDLLWFDVPRAESDHLHAKELVADYYETAANEWGKEVVVNDRMSTDAGREHGDFDTPEYETFDEVRDRKWESCRGIGHSFGYNRAEDEDDHLSAGELVRSFADIVSKNGNLLINVGPRADGTIPEVQKRPLEGLGAWLDADGEAMFGTRPWVVPEDETGGAEVRYTWKDGDLYATFLSWPGETATLSVTDHADAPESAELLRTGAGLDVTEAGDGLRVETGERPADAPAYAVRLRGVENPR